MTEHERAGYEEALRVRWYRPEDVPTEENAAWHRVRPALRALIAAVRESEARS